MRDLLQSGDRLFTGSGTTVAGINNLHNLTPAVGKKIRILSLIAGAGGSFRWFVETVTGDVLWTQFTSDIQYDSGIEVGEDAIFRVDASFPTPFAWTIAYDEVPK